MFNKLSLVSIMVIAMVAFITPAIACEEMPIPNVDLGPAVGAAKDAAALAMLNPVFDPTTDSVQVALDASNFENRNAIGLSVGLPLIEDKLFLHGTFAQVFETDTKGVSMGLTYSF